MGGTTRAMKSVVRDDLGIRSPCGRRKLCPYDWDLSANLDIVELAAVTATQLGASSMGS